MISYYSIVYCQPKPAGWLCILPCRSTTRGYM